jgi:3',5'-cyclic AMP phosphodiesterase CpdA
MTFTIAHLSDTHLSPAPFPSLTEMRLKRFMGFVNWKRGRERLNDMPMLARLVADLRARNPDHVAMTGDIVNIALAIEFHRAVVWMRTLGDARDVSFTPGNHDAYVKDAMEGLARSFAPWTAGDAESPPGERFPYVRVRGEVAIIGLNSGVPTAPLMASGRLGKAQTERFARALQETGDKGLARVVLIHHPPLTKGPAPALRGLSDARDFEDVIQRFGAEAILHGHSHKRMVNHLPSRATRQESGKVPVIGVPSASANTTNLRQRAGYHLVRIDRAGPHWRVSVRARGLLPNSTEIGEREPLVV